MLSFVSVKIFMVPQAAIKVFSYIIYFDCLQLGDPQNRGASNADFHLSNLLSDHPNMKV